jgi:lambda family phage tail tape measure protein
MATATTNVQLNVTGNAQQQLQKIQKQVDGLGSAFGKLKNIVGGLAIGALVTNMFRAADAITDLADATNLSVSSILALRQAFQLSGGDAEGAETAILKLTGSIQEAADGNDNLIEAFEKVGVSLQDLGTLSEQEITNKVIKGLGQLGNGAEAVAIKMLLLGKNARSLDVKKFADQYNLLGKSLKDTEPGLKAAGQIFDNLQKFKGDFGAALAKQFSGLLTTLEKLTSNTESLAESLAQVVKILALAGTAYVIFAKILPGMKTLGDALFGGGKNAKFFGNQIRYIIMNIKSLPKNIAAFVLSLVGLKDILTSTAGRAGGIKSLSAALLNLLRIGYRFAGLAAIIGTVATALNFLIKMITGFDVLDWLGEKLSKVIDKFKEFAGLLLAGDTNYFKDTAEDVELTADMLEEVTSEAANTRDRLKGIREENERFIKSVQDVTKAYKEQNAETLQSLGNDIKYLSMTEEQIALDKNRIALHKEFLSVLDELGKKREEALADPSKRSSGVVEQIDAEIKKVQESAVVTQTESAKKIKAYYAEVAALKDVQNAIEDQARAFTQAEKLQDLQDQLSLIGLYGEELEKQKVILEAEKALREEMQRLSIDLLHLESERARIGEEAYNKERARIVQQMLDTKALSEAKIKAYEEEQAKKLKIDESYAEGATRAMKDIAEQFKPINMAQEAVQKGWSRISDAIDTFVDTGKFKFSDFARSVIADLAKMIAKALIFKAISAALGAFGLKLPGMAEGGDVKSGKAYLVGEKGPEIFVPPGAGKIVPNKDLQGNGKGSNNVAAPVTNNYNTYNISALDAKSVAQMFAENRKAIFGANKMAEREMSYAGAR